MPQKMAKREVPTTKAGATEEAKYVGVAGAVIVP
jgi:hypothetical protein